MFGFLIKKAFFDTWDNFLPIVLYNIGFIALLAIPAALPSALAATGPAVQLTVLVVGVLTLFLYLAGLFGVARAISTYEQPTLRLFVDSVRTHGAAALAFGGMFVLHLALLSLAVPFYAATGEWLGLFSLAVLFWVSVAWWLAFQYLLPLRTRLGDRIGKCLRKSLLLVFDNVLFSIGLAIGALVIAVISVITAMLVFGPGGLAVWYQDALKLRMLKYDYIEENPDRSRRAIPWDALLIDERERVGKRTLRGFIFPWKD